MIDETPRPRLYLDLDGVINVDIVRGAAKEGYASIGDAKFRIRWDPRVVEFINDLDVDLWYCTTWREHAVESFGPLVGLREAAGVIHPNLDPNEPLSRRYSIAWKIPAIKQHQALSPSPFIHIDDEAYDLFLWPEEGEELGGLILAPSPAFGITQVHMDKITAYLNALPS